MFRTPARIVALQTIKGVWDAVFILYVIVPALFLYEVSDEAGAFDTLRVGIETYTPNNLLHILAFGWVFASFLQSIAGFGTPIAVVAPLLVALGVTPIYAVAIPLIGHAWANMFGTLAVGWLATLQVVDLENTRATAFQTGLLLWIPNILGGLGIAWFVGRWAAVRHAWPMLLAISLVQGGVQLLLTLWNPVLSAFVAATLALGVIYPLSRWDRFSEPTDEVELRVFQEGHAEAGDDDEEQRMSLWMAVLPYAVLTAAALIGLVIPPVEEALAQFQVGFPFPAVETGYGMVNEAQAPYSPFEPLTHPGTFLLIASLVGWLVYRARGYYREEKRAATRERQGFWRALAGDAVPASVAVVAFLTMSRIMDHSGQTTVLAEGIAAVAPPVIYAFASNWIGVLGAFMTSSNTASNVLFAPLQETVAQLEDLSEPAIIGAQSTGGAVGNAIAPAKSCWGRARPASWGRRAPSCGRLSRGRPPPPCSLGSSRYCCRASRWRAAFVARLAADKECHDQTRRLGPRPGADAVSVAVSEHRRGGQP